MRSLTVCKYIRQLALAVIAGFSAPVFASNSVQIGPEFQILTQIQGGWVNECRRAGLKSSEGFRRDFLNVTFTHFELVAKIYGDENCNRLLTQWPAKFRFALGGPILLPNQEKVFQLNLAEESDPADAWALSVNNILLYKSGHLYLGYESLLGPSVARLTKLNHEQFFTRR
ncbi:MAG: hypothetical protein RL497_3150 [Pseudomonadota bacterium]|jgi:hypothetical protein